MSILHIMALGKEEKPKPKLNKEIKIQEKINRIRDRKAITQINKIRCWSLTKNDKIDKLQLD